MAHVGFITAGYAQMDGVGLWSETVTLATQYPGMLQAYIGTALLLLVGATSAVIVRRRLRYEFWYVVHLMAYLGIFLAWFHQIPTGNELVVNPVAAAYWTALYILTLQLLIAFRILQPAATRTMAWNAGGRCGSRRAGSILLADRYTPH